VAVRLTRVEQVERNRNTVIDAARRVFLSRGYAGATLEAIAEEAGFSKGVVYSQFESKADLFLALLQRRIDERAAENERIAARRAGVGALHALLDAAERDARAEVGWMRVLVEFRGVALHDDALNRRYAALHTQTVERLADVLGRFLDHDGVPAAVTPRGMAEFILAIGSGITLERSVNPDALPASTLLPLVSRAFGLDDSE
jgi:AcrR family transcriptional regulator